jgi:hypothetical protein
MLIQYYCITLWCIEVLSPVVHVLFLPVSVVFMFYFYLYQWWESAKCCFLDPSVRFNNSDYKIDICCFYAKHNIKTG